MKISLCDLYVVESKREDSFDYFICKQKLNGSYIEVLTKTPIPVNNETQVEPLSNYYSPLERMNYTTGKPLMLNKEALLTQYIRINRTAHQAKQKEPSLYLKYKK